MDADQGADPPREEGRHRLARRLVLTLAFVKTAFALAVAVAAMGSSGGDKAGAAMASG